MTADLPIYPDSRPVDINDKSLLQGHFRQLQPLISEFSFANLLLFSNVHQYKLAQFDDSLVIFGRGYDGQPYFLPPLSGDRGAATRRLLQAGQTLYGADERFAVEHLGSGFQLIPDPDNSDYLYSRSELAELPGKRFHKKKNRINYFASRHRFRVEPFSSSHRQGALRLLDDWRRIHIDNLSRSLEAEIEATGRGLELADELGLAGVVILVDRGVVAFALGEELNDTTFVCHFEKADPFLEGVAQLVNREFSRSLAAGYTHVNREQDLGESGLKAAKLSYHPVSMVKKFRVRLAD